MEQSINEILLFAFAQPDYARTEYFKQQQEKLGYKDEEVFRQKLQDACNFFYNEMHKNDWRRLGGAEILDRRLPLFFYSKGQLTGHLGEGDLESLRLDIDAAFISNREILTQAYKKNGGGLVTEEIKALAKKYNKSEKNLIQVYKDIKEDLKKLK